MKTLPVLVFLALLGGCRCVVPLHQAMDDLRNAGFRSWSTDESVSLLSPWGEEATLDLREEIARAMMAIEAEFQTTLPRPLHVALSPVEDETPGASGTPSIHGVEAYAVPSENTVVILVDGKTGAETDGARLLRTLQHEIAHLAAGRLGLGGKTWFREGLAIEAEYATVRSERLVRSPSPEPLLMARRVHEETSLAEVLHWAENGGAILEGEEEAFWAGRPLAHSLMRFLLLRFDAEFGDRGHFLEGLLKIQRLNESEILALEPEWHAWLASGS